MEEQAKRAWVEKQAERLRQSGYTVKTRTYDWLGLYWDGRNPEQKQRELNDQEFADLLERLKPEPGDEPNV